MNEQMDSTMVIASGGMARELTEQILKLLLTNDNPAVMLMALDLAFRVIGTEVLEMGQHKTEFNRAQIEQLIKDLGVYFSTYQLGDLSKRVEREMINRTSQDAILPLSKPGEA